MESSQKEANRFTPGRRSILVLMVFAVLVVLVSFFFWYDTWFGRQLSDLEITSYLNTPENPRKVQHALSQIADRLINGDPTVNQWYDQILVIADHPKAELRATAAWVMGEDTDSQAFHQTLRKLLTDSDLMVRRNAALGLVRFGDDSGRKVILGMLQSASVNAPVGGRISIQLKVGQAIGAGDLLARITQAGGTEVEVRAPLSGKVSSMYTQNEATVVEGHQILFIGPEPNQIWEALRGLFFVGQVEDLPEIDHYARGVAEMPERIRQQALETSQAIRTREEHNSIH